MVARFEEITSEDGRTKEIPDAVTIFVAGETYETRIVEEEGGLLKMSLEDQEHARHMLEFRGRVLANENIQFVSINNKEIRSKPDVCTFTPDWDRCTYVDNYLGETYECTVIPDDKVGEKQ